MSLYDYFGHSIAGLRAAEALLDQAARIIADPAQWGMGSTEEVSPYATFDDYIASAVNDRQQGGVNTGGGIVSAAKLPSGSSMMKDLGVGMGMGPSDILDAMIAALMAQRMYEANARLFDIENRVVGILVHIGESDE
jgi:hypothetical protein